MLLQNLHTILPCQRLARLPGIPQPVAHRVQLPVQQVRLFQHVLPVRHGPILRRLLPHDHRAAPRCVPHEPRHHQRHQRPHKLPAPHRLAGRVVHDQLRGQVRELQTTPQQGVLAPWLVWAVQADHDGVSVGIQANDTAGAGEGNLSLHQEKPAPLGCCLPGGRRNLFPLLGSLCKQSVILQRSLQRNQHLLRTIFSPLLQNSANVLAQGPVCPPHLRQQEREL
mmetsp:Transcript_41566/g.109475  ORF Transcript_41566/g.109475 Transcript_41566/m.109475 type:complete len:224 (-) Transcript_41566:1447-2118(-)